MLDDTKIAADTYVYSKTVSQKRDVFEKIFERTNFYFSNISVVLHSTVFLEKAIYQVFTYTPEN